MRSVLAAGAFALSTLAATLAAAPPARALTQPGGAAVPAPLGCNAGKPTGLAAALACVCDQPGVCNVGAPCTGPTSCDDGRRATCETTLAHAFNDNTCIPSKLDGLDPYTMAAVTPETFRPSCALTFTVVTRGTAIFANAFGWYNVTGQRPDASDLHVMLGCGDAPGTKAVLDIKQDPAYRGGDVGFFLVTPESLNARGRCAGGDCCATVARAVSGQGQVFYSERRWNPDAQPQGSLIHLLVMDSKVTPRKFYFAWEDTYGAANNDFTDLVTSVDGVECSGGGAACATGNKGLCGRGVTRCEQGALACVPVLAPSVEACNGLDDDCDGVVDDDARCPTPGDVCAHGRCVPPCGGVEFPCGPGTQCDRSTGLCVDATCAGVACGADEVCRAGRCHRACDGVVCPKGQTCTGAACVDLCAGKACPAGQACRDGVCFAGCAQCGGMACDQGTTCDATTGACVDRTCATPCPDGTFCEAGACKDACAGVTCPLDGTCAKGRCTEAPGSTPSPGAGAGGDIPCDPPSPAHADAGAPADAPTSGFTGAPPHAGCGCTSSPGGATFAPLACAAAALAAGTARRRRRSERKS